MQFYLFQNRKKMIEESRKDDAIDIYNNNGLPLIIKYYY